MLQLTITIGRNVGNVPMPEDRWARFVEDTLATVRRHGYEVVVRNFGEGTWQASDGEVVTEENFIVVGIAEDFAWPSAERRQDAIRHEVRHLAYVYGQDAIAIGFGTSELQEG
jgi:hypothetical protein